MSQNTSSAVMAQRVEALEEWRPVGGWPGYEVSSRGRVRSWKHAGPGRKWRPDYSRPPRILTQDTRNSYKSVLFCDERNGRQWQSVHVLVLEAFVGPRPKGMQGAHGLGGKVDNSVWNLRWATPKENNADKLLHGTHQYGELIGNSKLTTQQAIEIKRRYAAGEKRREIAEAFDVHPNTVWLIGSGRAWSKGLLSPCRARLERPEDYPQKPIDFAAEAQALDDTDLFGGAA